MMKRILVVIDMQNDFITGSLGSKEAEKIVENVKNRILTYDKNDVFATKDTHDDNYLNTLEGKNLPVKHCILGTKGYEIDNSIINLIKEDNIFIKRTFGSLDLAKKIKQIAIENNNDIEIEICGLCTDICVISNALILKATLPEVNIFIDKKLTAGVTEELKNNALNVMKSCQINVI